MFFPVTSVVFFSPCSNTADQNCWAGPRSTNTFILLHYTQNSFCLQPMHHTSKMLSFCCLISCTLSSTTSSLAADGLPHGSRSIPCLSSMGGSLMVTQRYHALQQVTPAVLQSCLGVIALNWLCFLPLVGLGHFFGLVSFGV